MRRASFMHTQSQMRAGAAAARSSSTGHAAFSAGSKDVTRRMRWEWAAPGLYLLAVSKSQGLAPGESAEIFGVVQIVDVRREPLNAITADDVRREGFPGMSPAGFVSMSYSHMGAKPFDLVRRIEFLHVDPMRVAGVREHLTPAQANRFGIDPRACVKTRQRRRAA
jgi:hypothetical protein